MKACWEGSVDRRYLGSSKGRSWRSILSSCFFRGLEESEHTWEGLWARAAQGGENGTVGEEGAYILINDQDDGYGMEESLTFSSLGLVHEANEKVYGTSLQPCEL